MIRSAKRSANREARRRGFSPAEPPNARGLDTILRKVSTAEKLTSESNFNIASYGLSELFSKNEEVKLRRSRKKLYSRSIVGLTLPGQYWFITFTSTPKSPKIENSWPKLRWWLRWNYKEAAWLYCVTKEGYGVLHMIMRSEKRPDIKEIRAYWYKIHEAKIVNIKKVHDKKGLANYISDQRRRKGMAVEMYNQPTIERWRMSVGWVPKAFMKAFGQFYQRYGRDLDDITHDEVLRDWIIEVTKDYERIKDIPYVHENRIYWSGEKLDHTSKEIENVKTTGS